MWGVGDVEGYEHDVSVMPEAPDPETLPSLKERLEKLQIAAVLPVLDQLRRARHRLDRRSAGVGEPARDRSGVGPLVPVRPAQHLRRPVGRRVPVADPARHRHLARREQPPPARPVHRAEHRHLGRLPPLPSRRAVAVQRVALDERGQRPHRRRRDTCGRTTARCSPSARASCSAGPRRADRT